MKRYRKLLFLEPCYVDFGGYIRAIGLARALAKRGYKIDLLVSKRTKFSLTIRKTIIDKNIMQYELPRIEVNSFVSGRLLRAIIGCWFVLWRRYDIIHAFALVQFESNIPFLLATFLRKRVVADWDDYWTDAHILVPIYNNPPIRAYLKFCEYHLQKLAKHATATSEFLLKEYEKIGVSHRLKVINGVYEQQFIPMSRMEARKELGIPSEQKMLLTFGNTFFRERTAYLFRAFEMIFHNDPSVILYFNNDPRKIIREQAPDEEFDPAMFENIKNVGYLSQSQLSQYLGAADAILFTMGDSTLEKACFPTRLGTFILGGVPILTNNTDTEACRILKEHQCAVIGEDIGDLARKAVQLLNDPEMQKDIRENVRRAKDRLTWDAYAYSLSHFYQEIQ